MIDRRLLGLEHVQSSVGRRELALRGGLPGAGWLRGVLQAELGGHLGQRVVEQGAGSSSANLKWSNASSVTAP
jgi:hypothetical protein